MNYARFRRKCVYKGDLLAVALYFEAEIKYYTILRRINSMDQQLLYVSMFPGSNDLIYIYYTGTNSMRNSSDLQLHRNFHQPPLK